MDICPLVEVVMEAAGKIKIDNMSDEDFYKFQFDRRMIYRKNIRIDKRQVVMYVTSIKDYLLFYEKIVNWLSTA